MCNIVQYYITIVSTGFIYKYRSVQLQKEQYNTEPTIIVNADISLSKTKFS